MSRNRIILVTIGIMFSLFQMGRVESFGEIVISRRRASPRVECGASEVVWRRALRM
jgi:hypothetical protein